MIPLDEVTPRLVETLRRLGDDYGAMGVALAAARLTDIDLLTRELVRERERPRLVAQMEDLDCFIPDTDERAYVLLDDVIDVIRGRHPKPQDARDVLNAARRAAARISDQDRASIQEGFRRADEDTRHIRDGGW